MLRDIFLIHGLAQHRASACDCVSAEEFSLCFPISVKRSEVPLLVDSPFFSQEYYALNTTADGNKFSSHWQLGSYHSLCHSQILLEYWTEITESVNHGPCDGFSRYRTHLFCKIDETLTQGLTYWQYYNLMRSYMCVCKGKCSLFKKIFYTALLIW